MSGILYVVGTPIGNLGDMTSRAIKTLEQVDMIAAEDTRVTIKLLNHFNIKKPMISYHEHNIREKGEEICSKIQAGSNIAIVTDAGMPCISDPGEDLVCLCGERGITVCVIPGPTAAMSALAISGLNTKRFSFEGFLTVRKSGRYEILEKIKDDDRTLIFYEAPHKLKDTLEDIFKVFGNRKIAVIREMTKIYEQVLRTDLQGAITYHQEVAPRGEYVLVVEGAPEKSTEEEEFTIESAVDMVITLFNQNISMSQAAKDVAKQTSFKKSDLYKLALEKIG